MNKDLSNVDDLTVVEKAKGESPTSKVFQTKITKYRILCLRIQILFTFKTLVICINWAKEGVQNMCQQTSSIEKHVSTD